MHEQWSQKKKSLGTANYSARDFQNFTSKLRAEKDGTEAVTAADNSSADVRFNSNVSTARLKD